MTALTFMIEASEKAGSISGLRALITPPINPSSTYQIRERMTIGLRETHSEDVKFAVWSQASIFPTSMKQFSLHSCRYTSVAL